MAREVRKIHLIGIGGTAMAALAAMLQSQGVEVTGSDQALYPPMSEFLAEQGIPVREGFSPRNLDPDVELVVIGNALSRGNEEVEAVLDRKIPFRSLPEVLRDRFIQGKDSLVVTGTHGKTTTSCLLAWILHEAGRDPSFMVGGIPSNFSAGFQLGRGPHMVLEGDEYDTAFFDKRPKFLHYLPRIVTLGALEFDHADIYSSMEELMRAFRWLLRVIPRSGRFIVSADDPNAMSLSGEAPCPVVTCGLKGDVHWEARGIRWEEGMTRFRVLHRGREQGEAIWPLAGRHNVLNALLALAAAHEAGVSPEQAIPALATFRGVRRRLEYLGEFSGVRLYDDFAHHPTAIRVTLEALRALYPRNRIWCVVEPRSNTMCRRVFQGDLPTAFASADRVVLGAVHRADRLSADQRLDPAELVEALRQGGKEAWHVPHVADIVRFAKDEVRQGDVVCFMSNGAFGNVQRLLREALASP